MSELIVVRGPGKGSTVALSPERGVGIGTAFDAAIRIGGAGIAPEHVVVKALKGGGFGAKALQGEFLLNGKATAAARLSEGDLLQIGDTELRYTERQSNQTPQELSGFALLGVLGKGGMGVVWRAEQRSLGREVALKVLSSELTADPVFVGRFQAEARAAARLHHPNVVQVFDVDHVDETWFYSMELMHGGSLETRLKREGKLPVDEAVHAMLDATRGLAFAEQVQIVHRDIKPDNLMVDRHGHVKLADLGLAQVEDGDDDKLRGTPHFMSPEQVQRKPLDHRSDLYSLGCTFYRLLTGRTPFAGDSVKEILRAQLNETPTPANKVEPSVPAEVSAIVDKLLQKDPAARYQSANELVDALEQTLAPPTRKGLWIALGAVAVIAIGIAIALAMRDPEIQTIKVSNPEEAARLAQQARELEAQSLQVAAEKARLAIVKSGLTGLALAQAFEKVAAEHTGTQAAKDAVAEARRLRTEVAEEQTRSRQRAEAIQVAVSALEQAVAAELAKPDLVAALAAAAAAPTDPTLADANELTAARARARDNIAGVAQQSLDGMRRSVEQAEAARDLDAMTTALDQIASVTSGEKAWPDALVVDRAGTLKWIGERRDALTALTAAIESEREAAAAEKVRNGLFGAGGALEAAVGLRFGAAADRFAELGADDASPSLSALLLALVPSLRAAESYAVALEQIAAAGTMTLPVQGSDETATLVAFTRGAEGPSVTLRTMVRQRPQQTVIDKAQIDVAPAMWLPPVDGVAPTARDAALAWLALARQMRDTAAYLAAIRPADETSGTGADAFRLDPLLGAAGAGFAGTTDPVFAPLALELDAAQLIARGLQAFATRRNTTAAALMERVFKDHRKTLVVRAQR